MERTDGMEWSGYAGILRRRWLVLLIVIAIDVIAAGFMYQRSRKAAGYQACSTLFVADIGAPSLISAPPTSLDTAGQLLAGETAANFFGDDILDVAQSTNVASYVSTRLAGKSLPSSAVSDINGFVSGSRHDRTVSLCVTNSNSDTALAADAIVGSAMSSGRARFVGKEVATRTYVAVISKPSVSTVPAASSRTRLALEFILGLLVAASVALLWDALDTTVRDGWDLERLLDVPVASVKV